MLTLAWIILGSCYQSPTPDDWYADRTDPDTRERYFRAKAVCYNCPVRMECLTYAQETRESEGVWGGYDPDERYEMRRNLLRSMSRRRVLAS